MRIARGLTFSWRRASGLTGLMRRVAKTTGVPLTRTGRRAKLGRWFGVK